MKITTSIYILFLWIGLTISTKGYSQTVHLSDSSWHQMVNQKISNLGQWAYFMQRYDNGTSKGVLYHVTARQAEYFEKPADSYLDNDLFALRTTDNKVFVRDFRKKTKAHFD